MMLLVLHVRQSRPTTGRQAPVLRSRLLRRMERRKQLRRDRMDAQCAILQPFYPACPAILSRRSRPVVDGLTKTEVFKRRRKPVENPEQRRRAGSPACPAIAFRRRRKPCRRVEGQSSGDCKKLSLYSHTLRPAPCAMRLFYTYQDLTPFLRCEFVISFQISTSRSQPNLISSIISGWL